MSPLSHVRNGLPPILTIHGDADTIVPYEHARRLHQALDATNVPNELVTLPGGPHEGFSAKELLRADEAIAAFLKKHAVLR
jgi:dipeptidyl aminopeptidase/acylaminoacyl peptidase